MSSTAAAGWEDAVAANPERELLVPQEDHQEPAVQRCTSCGRLGLRSGSLRPALWAAVVLGCLPLACLAAVAALGGLGSRHSSPPGGLRLQRKFGAKAEPSRGDSCTTKGGMPACPAIGLFDQPEVHKVAAENIVGVGQRLLTSPDMELVLDIVASSFGNVSRRIQRAAPRLSVALQMIQLSDEQREAVLSCLRLMGNPRVQKIGLEVARALGGRQAQEPEDPKERLQKRLRPLAEEIRQLRDEVVPLHLQRLWGYGHLWEMTLDMEKLHVVGSGDGSANLDSTPGVATFEEMSRAIELGALEEGRALADLVKQIARLYGQEVAVPTWTLPVSDEAPHGDLRCEISSLEANAKDLLRAWRCPLQFGSQGVDALRAAAQLPMVHMDRINLYGSLRGSRDK